jgi:basic membrane lipoprotein Med (substrate-binding protein (PBP1-ABC) superfamily)
VSDAGWNAAAFHGLQEIKQALNVETALVQTQSPADFEDSLRDFASRGSISSSRTDSSTQTLRSKWESCFRRPGSS